MRREFEKCWKAEVFDSDKADTKKIDKTANTPLLKWGVMSVLIALKLNKGRPFSLYFVRPDSSSSERPHWMSS